MKNRQIYDTLEEILRNIRISDHFEESTEEDGESILRVFKPNIIDRSENPSESRYRYSVDRLTNTLYRKYHCGSELSNRNHLRYNQNMKTVEDFVYTISKSNLGLGNWDYGWTKKYLDIAEQGIYYEDQWYDKYLANWPDFRNINKKQQSKTSFSYADAWCHGSPGIILSRLLYYEISKDKKYLDIIFAVLDNILNKVKNQKYLQSNNFSLCHGIAGNCEALIHGSCLFDNSAYIDTVMKAALYGMTMYREVKLWPCGNQLVEAQTPGLMLGLSGIGYFYLRLYDDNTPSILAI